MQIDRVNGKQPHIKPKNYTYQDYKESLELLKQNPYISDVKGERNIDSEEAKIRIQDALDKLNIPWKAEIKDDVLARMCVLPNKIIHIQKEAKFDETDIDGLIEHEIKGHILKRSSIIILSKSFWLYFKILFKLSIVSSRIIASIFVK